jgi:hypothetical protein
VFLSRLFERGEYVALLFQGISTCFFCLFFHISSLFTARNSCALTRVSLFFFYKYWFEKQGRNLHDYCCYYRGRFYFLLLS